MKNKKIISTFLLLVLLSTTLLAVPAHAQTTGSSGGNFFSGLINFITQKFGLDKTQVQSAVSNYRKQNKPTPKPTLSPDQIQTREKTRLDKLVTAGTITAAQESMILAEDATLRTKYNPADLKNMTADQRKTQMANEQTDIKAWASTNNIDTKYLMFGGIGGMRGGFRGHFGPKPTTTP